LISQKVRHQLLTSLWATCFGFKGLGATCLWKTSAPDGFHQGPAPARERHLASSATDEQVRPSAAGCTITSEARFSRQELRAGVATSVFAGGPGFHKDDEKHQTPSRSIAAEPFRVRAEAVESAHRKPAREGPHLNCTAATPEEMYGALVAKKLGQPIIMHDTSPAASLPTPVCRVVPQDGDAAATFTVPWHRGDRPHPSTASTSGACQVPAASPVRGPAAHRATVVAS